MRESIKSGTNLGYLLVILSALAFSFKSILAKYVYQYGVDPMTIVIMRLGISVPLLFALLYLTEGAPSLTLSLKEVPLFLIAGVIGLGFSMVASFYAIEAMEATLATITTYTYPAMTVMLLVLFSGERFRAGLLLPLVFTFVGLSLALNIDLLALPAALLGYLSEGVNGGSPYLFGDIFGYLFSGGTVRGVIFALSSAFTFAIYNLLNERFFASSSPVRVTAFSIAFAFTVIFALFGAREYPGEAGPWVLALGLSVICGVTPMVLFLYGVKMIGASKTAITSSISPIFTILWAALFLGEVLEPVQLFGMAMVLVGIMVLKAGDLPTGLLNGLFLYITTIYKVGYRRLRAML